MIRRLALAVLVALAAPLIVLAPDPVIAEAPAGPTYRPSNGRTVTVTLVTGDVVTVTTRASGCPFVSVRPVERGRILSRSCGPDGHVRVVPADVTALVGRLLDPALFDVTVLVNEGYDDAHSADTPLIVQGNGTAVGSLRGRRHLSSLNAFAGRQPKAERVAFTGAAAPKRVWLDRRVRASTTGSAGSMSQLDPNLDQVGAPRAWREGYTGVGARVAVLDTGVDATHPDLVGRIVESANFATGGEDVTDRHGHGTHVAATIAGTGVGSGGQRRGVAPDAGLFIGKVLGDSGDGSESDVIAGMEWAAARADIVNMSLGGFEPSDGSDPLSLTLDALTERHGTLFVVAAGNLGSESSISFPGAARSALTVGAVDGTDTLADFSSRGPLVNTRAAKPEIVAPGVDIIAARAAGTNMGRVIDQRYTAASGTSMAAPHVAGAAAILAQRHPDWPAARLKAALTGGADPAGGGDVYALGAGRLDIPDSIAAIAPGQSVTNLGTFAYPQRGTSTTQLSWTNTGSIPMTLSLSVTLADRMGASFGAAALSTSSLRVEPGRSASVILRINRATLAAKPGLYAGIVTARTDQLLLRTPVALFVEPRSYDLTVHASALPGTPDGALSALALVGNIDDPAIFGTFMWLDQTGTSTARVPAGRYSIVGEVHDDTEGAHRVALAGDPDVVVDRDLTVVLDGAHARPVTATVDDVATETNAVSVFYVQTPRRGDAWWAGPIAWPTSEVPFLRSAIYAAPMNGVSVGSFTAYEYFSLDAPGDGASPYLYDLMPELGDHIPAEPAYRVTRAEHERLARLDQRFNRLDLPGSTTGHKRYGLSPEGALAGENDTRTVPARRVDYVSPGILWLDEAFYSGMIDYPVVTQESFRRYEPGSRQDKMWVSQPLRPDWYDDPEPSASFCAPQPIRRTRGNLHVMLVGLADAHQRFDCLEGDPTWEANTTKALALFRNERKVGEVGGIRADFAIPAEPADYRLTYDLDTSSLLSACTRISTAWTFRSAAPEGNQSAPIALLSLDYALPLDDANRSHGQRATFTVRQAYGVAPQRITSFRVWSSFDDGTSWTAAPVAADRPDQFDALLPSPAAGHWLSLRVSATGSAGSGVEQTIIRAYRAG